MRKVITYGTYDLIHYGHIRLLERAKELGDYLIVGVTSEDFDKTRGKINVQQSLMERIENVRATGLADEIIVEEYEGQKIDDICRKEIDVFAVGSDWVGKFDYLKSYCEVIYLERTEGISSSQIRSSSKIRLGLKGNAVFLNKVIRECSYVNGIEIMALCSDDEALLSAFEGNKYSDLEYINFLDTVDAVYIHSTPEQHYEDIQIALNKHKHVICQAPLSLNEQDTRMLFELAKKNNCVLQEAIKTAYSTAYARMILLIQSGRIGEVVSVDATCTSLSKETDARGWNSVFSWGPVALLPIFQIYGNDYLSSEIISIYANEDESQELLTSIRFLYPKGIATLKVGKGIKSEGELIISGTKGYIYVPAPWWKTDYFEIRQEELSDTKKYFYQLDGDGIRDEFISFSQKIKGKNTLMYVSNDVSIQISRIMESYNKGNIKKIIMED